MLSCSIRRTSPTHGKPVLDGFLKEWGFNVGTNIVVDASGIGQLLGTDASVPVAASYPSHPITDELPADDRLSAGAVG